MNKWTIFKYTFLSVGAGLSARLIVYNLLMAEAYTAAGIGSIVLKSIAVAIVTAFVLALINMAFGFRIFKRK